MVESLAKIMADFPGEANRSRCLAHIVNLVVKIILRQFDVSSKKKKNSPELNGDGDVNVTKEDIEEMERTLDKEEKEMDEGDEDDGEGEDGERLERDVDDMEDAMEEEIKEVSNQVKPVRQVLFKVNCSSFFLNLLPYPSFFRSEPCGGSFYFFIL
jgi:hypothetical protein